MMMQMQMMGADPMAAQQIACGIYIYIYIYIYMYTHIHIYVIMITIMYDRYCTHI